MNKLSKSLLIIFFAAISVSNSQYIEDALRYTMPNGIITPRAAAMNVSFHGISDDISALYYNPAGLSLIGKSEVSFGLGFTNTNNEATFVKTNSLLSSNNEYITHASIAIPMKFDDNTAAIAIGYFLEDDFNSNINFGGLNPRMSMISSEAMFWTF